MKIACLSDTHGFFPEVPDCDLLLLGGDYCPVVYNQEKWFNKEFKSWIQELSQRMKIIGVAGNHDYAFQRYPELLEEFNWTYLQDSGTEFEGLKIWGSPWQPYFHNWAFNLYEYELKDKWELIPNDTDILITHGPPLYFGDYVQFEKLNVGSRSLLNKIVQIQPKLHVCGHIHDSYGRYEIDNTVCYNSALLNRNMLPINPIQIFEI